MAQRRKPKAKDTISPWPADQPRAIQVSSQATYVGSPEHKSCANPVTGEPPHPSTDKSQCEAYPPEQWAEFTRLLRLAIATECTSDLFDVGGWPRYVWGWFEGRMFQARHRTDPPGNRYKGWLLEPDETPEDPGGRLRALKERIDAEAAPPNSVEGEPDA